MPTREETLLQRLIVGLPFVIISTLRVSINHILCMLAPNDEVHLFGNSQFGPVAGHAVYMYASIQTINTSTSCFGKLFRSRQSRHNVSSWIIKEEFVYGFLFCAVQFRIIPTVQSKIGGSINQRVVICKSTLTCFLIKSFVKGYHIVFTPAIGLPVINDAIVPEIHQGIEQWLYINESPVLFRSDKLTPFCIVGPTILAFEKHLTRHQTASVFMGSVCPTTGCLEKTVIPRTKVRRVVPHGINICLTHSVAGITMCALTSTPHWCAHEHLAFFVHIGVQPV